MVAYGSKLAHSSVERACLLGAVQYRPVGYDDNYSMRGDLLEKAIEADVQMGLTPFYVVATLGTTSCCSFDNLKLAPYGQIGVYSTPPSPPPPTRVFLCPTVTICV